MFIAMLLQIASQGLEPLLFRMENIIMGVSWEGDFF